MANDKNETVKTKKKEESIWKTIGKIGGGLLAIGGIIWSARKDKK